MVMDSLSWILYHCAHQGNLCQLAASVSINHVYMQTSQEDNRPQRSSMLIFIFGWSLGPPSYA